MTRGWKIGIGIFAAVVAFDLLLRALGSVTGGTPGGPNGSSYATARNGVAAYATLLGRARHRVDRSRELLPPGRRCEMAREIPTGWFLWKDGETKGLSSLRYQRRVPASGRH